MSLSDAEKKRRSRARKSAAYHAIERETTRKRMAIYRAKNRAKKKASHLASHLSEADRRIVQERVARRRRIVLAEWFRSRDLELDLAMIEDEGYLKCVMMKVDLHGIELQLARFEISIIKEMMPPVAAEEDASSLAEATASEESRCDCGVPPAKFDAPLAIRASIIADASAAESMGTNDRGGDRSSDASGSIDRRRPLAERGGHQEITTPKKPSEEERGNAALFGIGAAPRIRDVDALLRMDLGDFEVVRETTTTTTTMSQRSNRPRDDNAAASFAAPVVWDPLRPGRLGDNVADSFDDARQRDTIDALLRMDLGGFDVSDARSCLGINAECFRAEAFAW